MKLGLYTESFGKRPFGEMLDIAASMRIQSLEFGTGNWSRPAHLDLDLMLDSQDARGEFLAAIHARGLELEALNCSGNHLEPSESGQRHAEVVEKTFRLAELLGVRKIVMMSGLPGGGPDAKYPVWVTNLWPPIQAQMLKYQWNEVAIPWWREAVRRAHDRGIERICLENHPNTLVFSAGAMRRLRDAVGEAVGMNLDPSHAFYMGGDPITMAKRLASEGMIYHVHGKDTRIAQDVAGEETLLELGFHGEGFANHAWNYVAVGFGHDQLWWRAFLTALKANGYDGVVSMEVGDPTMDDITAVGRSAAFLLESMP